MTSRVGRRSDDDALVLIHRLTQLAGKPMYEGERTLLRSELEAEYHDRQ